MVDVHTPIQRSRNMAAIKGKNTKPELMIRKELHRLGFRYRIHYAALPGSPDLVFPKYKAVIQINGCLWHKHECHIFKWPEKNAEFWREKIEKNFIRDSNNSDRLSSLGWKSLVIWECALKGRNKIPLDHVIGSIVLWLRTEHENKELRGVDLRF